jgi:hypothetical protein
MDLVDTPAFCDLEVGGLQLQTKQLKLLRHEPLLAYQFLVAGQ